MVRLLDKFRRRTPTSKERREETNRVFREEICKEILESRRLAQEHEQRRDEFDRRQQEIEARLSAVRRRTALIQQRRSE